MTTKARDEADDVKDERQDARSDARKDTRVEARRTKDGELDTTHLPESINEPPGSDVIVADGDGENTVAEKRGVKAVGAPTPNARHQADRQREEAEDNARKSRR